MPRRRALPLRSFLSDGALGREQSANVRSVRGRWSSAFAIEGGAGCIRGDGLLVVVFLTLIDWIQKLGRTYGMVLDFSFGSRTAHRYEAAL